MKKLFFGLIFLVYCQQMISGMQSELQEEVPKIAKPIQPDLRLNIDNPDVNDQVISHNKIMELENQIRLQSEADTELINAFIDNPYGTDINTIIKNIDSIIQQNAGWRQAYMNHFVCGIFHVLRFVAGFKNFNFNDDSKQFLRNICHLSV